jgi:hypothetical protein
MDWLDHLLTENSYLVGAIIGVITFVVMRVFSRPTPVRTAPIAGAVCCLFAAFMAMPLWPPTLVQSKILLGTILACFPLGLMLSQLDSITFDTATHEFVIERSVLSSALTALFLGVGVALLPHFWVGVGHPFGAAAFAWIGGGSLGQWRRIVRAGGA